MKKGYSNKIYAKKNEEYTALLNNRPYRLGLDLGVGSIGYALVALEEFESRKIPAEVIFCGSRIFTPSTGAAERRQKRGERNSHRHKTSRLAFLWKILAEKQLALPYTVDQTKKNTLDHRFSAEIQQKDVFQLRYKGLTEKLEPEETGYCLYHMANHRGSSSVRTDLDTVETAEEKKLREMQAAIDEDVKKDKEIAFIEILMKDQKNGVSAFRRRNKNPDVRIPTREVILNEVKKLLETQKKHYPALFTDEYVKRILAALNFENTKIVPESGFCPFFTKEKRLPKCHFLNEERRLWEALNNAFIKIPVQRLGTLDWEKQDFTDSEKQILFGFLRQGNRLTEAGVRKLLPFYAGQSYKFSLQGKTEDSQKIEGFRFKSLEDKNFWKQLSEEQQDAFLSDWVNCPDDQQLTEKLVSQYGLSQDEAWDALRTVKLVGDYAPTGKSAMLALLPHIKAGKSWTEAVDLCVETGLFNTGEKKKTYELLPYYGEVLTGRTQAIMGKAWHSAFEEKRNTAGFIKPKTCSDEEQFGRIANPVVHQCLNEVRKLTNELIRVFGTPPAEIGIEVSRELKLGQKKREELKKQQADNEKAAEKFFTQYCKPHNLSAKYIKHFKLLDDQQKICPYCLESINIDAVVNHRVDIDHILPEEDTGDSSYANLVLAHNECNAEKGKRPPFAAFGGSAKWPQIMAYTENSAMKFKRWRFLLDDEQYAAYLKNKGFLSRFSADTSYISRAAREYLSCLYEKRMNEKGFPVTTIKGGQTAVLRKAWGIQRIGYELGALHDSSDDSESLNKKSRLDYRHHALDAVAVAYSSPAYTHYINSLHAKGIPLSYIQNRIPAPYSLREQMQSDDKEITLYNEFFYLQIRDVIKNQAHISIKYDTDKNGEILKGTSYNILFADGSDLVFLAKKKITSIMPKEGFSDIEKALVPKMFTGKNYEKLSAEVQNLVKKYVEYNGKKFETVKEKTEIARFDLENQNQQLVQDGKRIRVINEFSILRRALELTGGSYYQLTNKSRDKVFVVREPTKEFRGFAYDTGENLCMDFYHDRKGILKAEIIRKIYAMKKDFVPAYKKQGYTLFERVYQGDTLEIDAYDRDLLVEKSTGLERLASIPTPNSVAKRVFVKVCTFTEVNESVRIWIKNISSSTSENASFTLGSMQDWNVRKIQLSPLGFVTYVSPVLKNKDGADT